MLQMLKSVCGQRRTWDKLVRERLDSMHDCIHSTRVHSQVAGCNPGDPRSMLITVVLKSRLDPVSKSKHDTIQACMY